MLAVSGWPLENTSQGRDGEPEKAHRKSIPVQVWGKFQVLQNCCYCCFQRQPKLNFSSVTNCSGSVSVSGVGKVLPSGTHQSSKKPESYTSPGLSHNTAQDGPCWPWTPRNTASTIPFSGINSKIHWVPWRWEWLLLWLLALQALPVGSTGTLAAEASWYTKLC